MRRVTYTTATRDEADGRAKPGVRLPEFDKAFGAVLTPQQLSACQALRSAMEQLSVGTLSACRYDGSPAPESFEPRSRSERAARLALLIEHCQHAVIAEVQMIHHDAWRVFRAALERDLTMQGVGDYAYPHHGRDRRRAMGAGLVQRSADAIKNLIG